ncbi:hypothetical protein Y032_0087g2040 [Ancylostoma ceylanicum]|uniref:Reverse transcriptase domain-containing protein n=1 Tax=Ancylostoma ceylanicum TaxID=53326 RepID=A0A016TND0_9BILA|nr:hypothetical protein Y032_0087g2040 [Ancylostoma ceylanicum]
MSKRAQLHDELLCLTFLMAASNVSRSVTDFTTEPVSRKTVRFEKYISRCLLWSRVTIIWYAMRRHIVSEEFIECVRILYADPRIRVKAAAGTFAEFPIAVGMNQGSAFCPLLFVIVRDAV